jgi:lysophospholipase L1-like esterase
MRAVSLSGFLMMPLHAFAAPAAAPLAPTHESRFVPSKIQEKEPLQLVAIGDSVLWGQGLKESDKSSRDVAEWLAKELGRPVHRTVYAHSGASIGETDSHLARAPGEVPQGSPSITAQVAGARSPERVDVLLLNGCINDVPASKIVLGSINTTDWRKVATTACYQPVKRLIRQALVRFPKAIVIFAGYYPFYTEIQLGTQLLRALGDELFCGDEPEGSKCREQNDVAPAPGVVRSKAWHEGSNQAIGKAIDELQSEFPGRKIAFAPVSFGVDDGYGSVHSKLWHLGERDDARARRIDDCHDSKKQAAKAAKKRYGIYCKQASTLHPNRGGARLYTRAIRKQLQALLPGLADPASK